jgi:MFS family permease
VLGFRRLVVGTGLSFVGDAMGTVAVPWLALELAPRDSKAVAVSLATIAFTLPGAVVGLLFPRAADRLGTRRLILLDSGARCVVLALIPALAWTGRLGLASYVILLGVSSIFHGWGAGGRMTLIARLIDEPRRMTANALVFGQAHVAFAVGPILAGLLIAEVGAPAVIGLDALSFAALFLVAATVTVAAPPRAPGEPGPGAAGLRGVVRHPQLAGLFGLTLIFYLLYGPTEVAVPLQVHQHLGGGAALFGALGAAFGVGAILGSLAAGVTGRWRLWPTALGIVAGWGAAVVVLGATNVPVVAIGAMAAGGLIFAPYPAIVTTHLQANTDPGELPGVTSAWASLVTATVPLGVAFGGPLVGVLGPRAVLLLSGGTTLLLALAGSVLVALPTRAANVLSLTATVRPTKTPGS